ncbi:MAG: hypothetical protein GY679_01135, partial [Mycoplasma sp.]|nr:hypothetical protein [Mycoplasma sp.]
MAINDNNLLINENSPEINDIRETTLESLPKEQLQKIYEYWKVTQLSQEVNQREQKRAFNTQSKINHFLNDKNITKKTKDNYKRILDIYMDFLALNSYHILDLNGDIALRFKSYLKTGKRTEPTITTYIRGVSSFYTYLIFVGDIQNNYFKGMIDKLHNKRAKDKGLMSETDYNSIIEHYQTSKKSKLNTLMPIIIEFLASTGLRVGALATIKIDKAGNYTTLTKGKEVKGSIEADLLTK